MLEKSEQRFELEKHILRLALVALNAFEATKEQIRKDGDEKKYRGAETN